MFLLLFEDHDDYDMRVLANDQIILHYRNENVNDLLINLLAEVSGVRRSRAGVSTRFTSF